RIGAAREAETGLGAVDVGEIRHARTLVGRAEPATNDAVAFFPAEDGAEEARASRQRPRRADARREIVPVRLERVLSLRELHERWPDAADRAGLEDVVDARDAPQAVERRRRVGVVHRIE